MKTLFIRVIRVANIWNLADGSGGYLVAERPARTMPLAAADSRQKVNLAVVGDFLQEAHIADSPVYGYREARPQAVLRAEPLSDAGKSCFERGDHLPHRRR